MTLAGLGVGGAVLCPLCPGVGDDKRPQLHQSGGFHAQRSVQMGLVAVMPPGGLGTTEGPGGKLGQLPGHTRLRRAASGFVQKPKPVAFLLAPVHLKPVAQWAGVATGIWSMRPLRNND